jgi:3-oxoacyl-[acyl-carrier protein] reductase
VVEGYEHAIVDVGDDQQVKEWVRKVGRSHGRIDVVVNNAGVFLPPAMVSLTSAEMVESTFRTNFLGTFTVCRESSKVMLRRRFGRIINISSIVTKTHMPGASIYAASKSAAVEFSKVLAKELIPGGITCNVVAVSLVESDTTSRIDPEAIELYKQGLVIGRWAGIEDVCNVVSFFASPDSSHVTGQVIHLDFVD